MRHVNIGVPDLAGVDSFFANTLDLPTAVVDDGVEVKVGHSVLTLICDPRTRGTHHLAFNVPANEFSAAKRWLEQRTALVGRGRRDEFSLAEPWNSQSVYFEAPGDLLLEFIARDRLAADEATQDFDSSHIQSISEIGIPVPDVPAAARTISSALGLDLFAAPHDQFHAMGDDNGLLILVTSDRTWFPTHQQTPNTGTINITLDGTIQHELALTSTCHIQANPSQTQK